jgi:hypothetical protein
LGRYDTIRYMLSTTENSNSCFVVLLYLQMIGIGRIVAGSVVKLRRGPSEGGRGEED